MFGIGKSVRHVEDVYVPVAAPVQDVEYGYCAQCTVRTAKVCALCFNHMCELCGDVCPAHNGGQREQE